MDLTLTWATPLLKVLSGLPVSGTAWRPGSVLSVESPGSGGPESVGPPSRGIIRLATWVSA